MRNTAFLLLMLAIILIAGCKPQGAQPALQCEADSDCIAENSCIKAACKEGICSKTKILNCCGNAICESATMEGPCNCSMDCPAQKCEGVAQFTTPQAQKVKAKYFTYGCLAERCHIRYDVKSFDPMTEYFTSRAGDFVLGIAVNYLQPFETNHANFSVEMELKSYDSQKMDLPLKINEIRIMDGTKILARQTKLSKSLTAIGRKFTVRLPVSYSMKMPEEMKKVTVEYDYEYMVLKKITTGEKDDNNQPIYDYIEDKTEISTARIQVAESIFFIDPNYDTVKVDFSQD